MAYVYFDQYGILHAVEDESTAKTYARNGKYVQADVAHQGGYLGRFQPIIVYDKGHGLVSAYINGNEKDGSPISLGSLPHIQSIVNQLLG